MSKFIIAMKGGCLLFLFLAFVFANNCLCSTVILGDSVKKSAYSDTSKKRDFIIKINLGTPLWWRFNDGETAFSGTIEKLFKKRYSVQLTVLGYGDSYNDFSSPINSYSSGYDRGVQLIPECKFFVSRKKRYSGYYVGAFGFFNFERDKQVFYPGSGQQLPTSIFTVFSNTNAFGFGLSNGVQFYLFKRIVVDVLVGLGIKQGYYNTGGKYDSQMDITGRMMLNVGYRFGLEKRKRKDELNIPWD